MKQVQYVFSLIFFRMKISTDIVRNVAVLWKAKTLGVMPWTKSTTFHVLCVLHLPAVRFCRIRLFGATGLILRRFDVTSLSWKCFDVCLFFKISVGVGSLFNDYLKFSFEPDLKAQACIDS